MFNRCFKHSVLVATVGLLALGLAVAPAAAQSSELAKPSDATNPQVIVAADKADKIIADAKVEAAKIIEAAKAQANKILAETKTGPAKPPAKPEPDFPLTKGPYRGATIGDFQILVPTNAKQADKGLKFLDQVPTNRGMVFVQKAKSPAIVTTGDCPALDLVFIAPDGAIQVIISTPAAKAGVKPDDLSRFTVEGACTKSQAETLAPTLAHTAFVVQVRAGEGARFAKSWKADMTDRFLNADPNHRVWGF
jgi:uncharacterized membrane protein (UPF0127 family)